ncbi:MAG: UDP-3-O-(3-hydroxymyristoyl)glucosamine N-acyltransferase [Candidatus Hydrogenedentota bacterium]
MDKKVLVKEIASFVQADVIGDDKTVISGISSIEDSQKGDITFALDEKYLKLALKSPATAIIISKKLYPKEQTDKVLLKVDNPRLSYAKVLDLFKSEPALLKGISEKSCIARSAEIGKNVCIAAFVYIGEKVIIEDNVKIYPNVTIHDNSIVREGTVIHANTSIYDRTLIGRNCLIHAGVVIGADGFGFVEHQKKHLKIPQIGYVEIGDEVEIGANVCIDRGTTGKTYIGNRVKIDNLVHIAHNVKIGDDSIIIAQVGISGSVKIGEHVTIAGQAGLASHINIGDNVVIAAKSGVTKSVPSDMEVSGFPARPHQDEKKLKVSLLKLPALIQCYQQVLSSLKRLSDRLSKLEKLN